MRRTIWLVTLLGAYGCAAAQSLLGRNALPDASASSTTTPKAVAGPVASESQHGSIEQPEAYLPPQEFVVDGKEFEFNAFVENLKLDQSVIYHLVGPGVDEQISRKAQLENGRAAEKCQSSFAGAPCRFPMSRLRAGRYELRIEVAGRTIATAPVTFVEEPLLGGGKELAVDPVSRSGTFYDHRGLAFWFPLDGRSGARHFTLSWFRDGRHVKTRAFKTFGPRWNTNRPAFVREIQTIKVDSHFEAQYMEKAPPGVWQGVLLRDGKDLVASFTLKAAARGGYDGIAHHARIPATAPSAGMLEQARENGAKEGPFMGDIRSEQAVCVIAKEAKGYELLMRLNHLYDQDSDSAARFGAAQEVLASGDATPKERAEARRTSDAMTSAQGPIQRAIAKVRGELAQASKRYKKGCLGQVFATPTPERF